MKKNYRHIGREVDRTICDLIAKWNYQTQLDLDYLYAYKRVDAWAKAHALLMLTVKLKFTSSAYITVDAPYSVTLQLSLQQTQLYLPHLFIILEEIKQQNDHFSREEVLHKENKRAKKNVTNNKIPTGVQAKQASSKLLRWFASPSFRQGILIGGWHFDSLVIKKKFEIVLFTYFL